MVDDADRLCRAGAWSMLPVDQIEDCRYARRAQADLAGQLETASRLRGRIERSSGAPLRPRVTGLGGEPGRMAWPSRRQYPAPEPVQACRRDIMSAIYPMPTFPPFIARLRARPAVAAPALRFQHPSSQPRGLAGRWARDGGDRSFGMKVWTRFPPQRTKAARLHRVLLSDPALAILGENLGVEGPSFRADSYLPEA